MSTLHATVPAAQTTGYDLRAYPPEVQQRAAALAWELLAPDAQLLADVIGADVLGLGTPYVPPDPQAEQLAQWLASPQMGLVVPVMLGYVTGFQASLLGRYVVWCWISEAVRRGEASYPQPPHRQPKPVPAPAWRR